VANSVPGTDAALNDVVVGPDDEPPPQPARATARAVIAETAANLAMPDFT
jgi:hypothetical protein